MPEEYFGIVLGQIKAMQSYLSNAESFLIEGDAKLTKENLVMLRDELYDALIVLSGEKNHDSS